MPALDRNGVMISYEAHGSGPAILLSHGYGASSEMWRDQVAVLQDRYSVICWDMRGHGKSDSPPAPDAYSEELAVGDMIAILDACGVDKAIVGGFSMGGYMSLSFCVRHPDRVRALMLVDTGPGFKNPAAQQRWNDSVEKWAALFRTEGLRTLDIVPEYRSAEIRPKEEQSAIGLELSCLGMVRRTHDGIIRALETIAVPTLVVVGADDAGFLRSADYMAEKIPNATKVIIENAGHAANLHQPAMFNQAMEDFLIRLPG